MLALLLQQRLPGDQLVESVAPQRSRRLLAATPNANQAAGDQDGCQH